MENKKTLIIVDPIFRGSRVYFTWLCAGIHFDSTDTKISVITRTASETDESLGYFKNKRIDIQEVVSVPEKFWYGKIEPNQIQKIIDTLNEIVAYSPNPIVYFAGLNELYPEVLLILLKNQYQKLSSVPMVFVEYDGRFFFDQYSMIHTGKLNTNIKNIFKTIQLLKPTYLRFALRKRLLLWRFHKRFPRAAFAVLDERILESRYLKEKSKSSHIFFLPDPAPEKSGDMVALAEHISKSKVNILIVGLQTMRKGLIDIIEVCESGVPEGLQFTLVGRLSTDTQTLRYRIDALAPLINFHEGFFEETEFQSFYQSCDYVILPYDKTFEGSSGVMSYAALYNKPLIASAHGCIGFRVDRFNLGLTYKSRNIAELRTKLESIPRNCDVEYKQFQANMEKFYRAHTIEAHRTVLSDKFLKLIDNPLEE